MPTRFFLSVLGAVAVIAGAAACTKQPEPAPKVTSDELDRSITAKINGDATLVAYHIDVDVDADKNIVTLKGSVPTESLRMKAVEAAQSAAPSIIVTDKIDVKPTEVERKDYTEEMARETRTQATARGESIGDTLDDAWVHTKVRAKLMTDGNFPGDDDLDVDVKNNVVTLRGTVTSAQDKGEAEQIAKSIDGVKSVRNMLVVKAAR